MAFMGETEIKRPYKVADFVLSGEVSTQTAKKFDMGINIVGG
jgi:hypothetical protein